MVEKLKKKFSEELFLFLSDSYDLHKIIKNTFYNSIEVEYQDFIILNTPPLCENLKERKKELIRIANKYKFIT